MTREEAAKLLPIIQAFVEGKTIQYKVPGNHDNRWHDAEDLSFLNPPENYRIKPEKVKLWVNLYLDRDDPENTVEGYIYRSKELADRHSCSHRIACVEIE